MLRALPIIALLVAACGSTPTRTTGTGGGAAAVEVEARPLPEPGRFYTPGLADYAGTTRLASDPLEERLRQLLKRSIDPPASLECLAREHAARFAADRRDPTPGATQAIADHCGYWGRPNQTRSATSKSEAELITYFEQIPLDKIPDPIAVGVARNPDGRVTGTLVVPPAEIKLDPVPRKPKGAVTLKGRLLQGDGTLEVWIGDGSNTNTKIPVQADPAGRFTAQLPAPKGQLPFSVEIVRKQGLFRHTMGLLTLNLPRQEGYAPKPKPAAARPTPKALVDAVNRARTVARITPMRSADAIHTRLDDWMARLASGEPTGPPPGLLDDRGWPYAITRFGFSAGVDADEAVQLLVDTPTGRRALLDARIDQVAIGVRPFPRGDGFDAVFLGLKRFESQPAKVVRDLIHQRLTTKRGNGVADNARLQAIAQKVADDVMAGRIEWKQAIPTLMEVVRTEKPVRGGFGAGGFTTADPATAELEKMRHAVDPMMKHIGLGIASGPLPGGGAPRYVIMYIVAERLPSDG